MNMIKFDTLKFVGDLVTSGMPESQARVIANAQLTINEASFSVLATKGDITSLRTELRTDIGLLKSNIDMKFEKEFSPIRADLLLIKWMLALIIITTLIPVT